MSLLDPRFRQGLSRRGASHQGSSVNVRPVVPQPNQDQKDYPKYMLPIGWQGPPSPGQQTLNINQALAKAASARQMGESVLAKTGGPVAPQAPLPFGAFNRPPNMFDGGGLMPGGSGEIPEGPARFNPMSIFNQPKQAGVDPTMKAIIDAMTGARVHKGMDGRQLGMGGVDPNVKYMLYAMRGRRHKGMRGEDIY